MPAMHGAHRPGLNRVSLTATGCGTHPIAPSWIDPPLTCRPHPAITAMQPAANIGLIAEGIVTTKAPARRLEPTIATAIVRSVVAGSPRAGPWRHGNRRC